VTHIEHTVADGIAHIRLDRPTNSNAFDLQMTRELASAVRHADEDSDVRVVLVSGAGPRFCAGGDVSSFAAAADPSAHLLQLATELDLAFQQLTAMDKPVVAAVHGAVAGAGLALLLSCDVTVADPGTKFAFAYSGIGLTPDCGLSYLLPLAIGEQRALSFALLGRPAAASEAVGWGLVSETADDALSRAVEIARAFADGPANALGKTKRLLRQSREMTRRETGQHEARVIAAAINEDEAQERIKAFVRR